MTRPDSPVLSSFCFVDSNLMRSRRGLTCACLAWLLACSSLRAQHLPRFRERVIANDLKFGYQLVAADLNADGKRDLIAVDERAMPWR